MRAIQYHKHGGSEVLQLETLDQPSPGPGEVLISVRATSVNGIDVRRRSGRLPESELPKIPGVDAAGVIEAVGDAVTTFNVGDRVFGVSYGHGGTYAEYITLPVENIDHLPASVSFIDGAATAHVGMTAWRAILDHGDLGLADTCLIHGAAGGVGHLAVRLAEESGATVVATAGAEETIQRVSEFGADHVLDFRRDDLAEAITEVAGGVDVILDPHLSHYLELDVEVAAHDGRIVSIAGNAPSFENVPTARIKDVTIQPMAVFNAPSYTDILGGLSHLLEFERLIPEITTTYDLAMADDAQQEYDQIRLGKILLSFD